MFCRAKRFRAARCRAWVCHSVRSCARGDRTSYPTRDCCLSYRVHPYCVNWPRCSRARVGRMYRRRRVRSDLQSRRADRYCQQSNCCGHRPKWDASGGDGDTRGRTSPSPNSKSRDSSSIPIPSSGASMPSASYSTKGRTNPKGCTTNCNTRGPPTHLQCPNSRGC